MTTEHEDAAAVERWARVAVAANAAWFKAQGFDTDHWKLPDEELARSRWLHKARAVAEACTADLRAEVERLTKEIILLRLDMDRLYEAFALEEHGLTYAARVGRVTAASRERLALLPAPGGAAALEGNHDRA